MSVLEAPDDSECYLWAILQDASGLDQAEFLWHEGQSEDGCFRAWPYQWSWWRCNSPLQIDCCGRSVGKSLSIQVRAFAFPFLFPGQEMVITGPEGVHVDAITDLIETRFHSTRLGREMLGGRGSVKHKPFHMNFSNGARIMGRIPQRDGKGVKGIHPIWLELDEAQDYPKNGWTELVETLKRGVDGAVWRAHGVTRGMRDKFYDFTQESADSDWNVHRYTAMHRPNWTDEERQEKIKQYGSRDDPDYRRNVLGAHGDATNPLFVLHRLMRCVEDDQSDPFNTDEYWSLHIKDTELEHHGQDITDVLDFPLHHKKYDITWIGMDVGFTADPSEVLIFAEYHPNARERKAAQAKGKAIPEEGVSRVKCIGRISMQRISHPQQVRAILHILDFYKPKAFAMDKTGNGLPLFQDVQDRILQRYEDLPMSKARQFVEVVKGYNFSEKVLVDIDESIDVEEEDDNDAVIKAAGIARNVLEYSTDALRDMVDNNRLWLPWDRELIGEFQGQTFTYSKGAMDQYGRRRRIFSEGSFHALDAARMAIMGLVQSPIEEFVRKPKKDNAPVFDSFIGV